MPITPTNISKNTGTFTGARKSGTYFWGDSTATWGDAVAAWGSVYSVSNISKSSNTVVTIPVGSPLGLLVALTHASTETIGNGWTNISKN